MQLHDAIPVTLRLTHVREEFSFVKGCILAQVESLS